MPFYGKEYIHTTIHDFKGNIAKYIRVLHSGRYQGVIVKRYSKPVGLFVALDQRQNPLSGKEGGDLPCLETEE